MAEKGAAPDDLDALFGPLDADPPGALDAVHDTDDMPLDREPARVRDDLAAARDRAAGEHRYRIDVPEPHAKPRG